MGTYQKMFDYSPRGVVSADEMDKIRENIGYLLEPNYVPAASTDAGRITFTSTTWAKVSAGYDKTIVTYGGPVLIVATNLITQYTGSGVLYVDLAVDGVRLGHATYGLWSAYQGTNFSNPLIGIAKPLAGTHTISIYAMCTAGTHYFNNSTSAPGAMPPLVFQAIEL